MFFYLLFPEIFFLTGSYTITTLLSGILASVVDFSIIYSGWKNYQKNRTVTEARNTHPKRNSVSRLIRKALFLLTIIAFTFLQFKLAAGFFLFYLLLNFVEIGWEEKWKYQLTKNKIKELYNRYIGYLADSISDGIDQIKNGSFSGFVVSYFLDLFGSYHEVEKRKKQILEDTKVPHYHKGINEHDMQKISDYFTKRFDKLDFETLLAQIISIYMYVVYALYLILNNGGIKDLLGYTNLEWYSLIGIGIFSIFIYINRVIRKKYRKASLINKVIGVWLTKQLNMEIERKNILNDWINLIIILALAILFTQFLNYFSNRLIGFDLYLAIFIFSRLGLSIFLR